ncbi:MAG: hypothetical protein HY875_08695 [Chloroflexi bacterium]|nr:hypothetical protein [Chloroflexota bacterium]
MRAALTGAALLLAALAQVTVASLFPWQAALPDLALLTLLLFAAFAGPATVMVGLPLLAISLGFASDRSPALILLAYLPLLPIASGLEQSAVPLNRYTTWLIAGLATGAWARLILAFGAIAQGASADLGSLAFRLVLPGLILDGLLLSMVYLPIRAFGWEGRGPSLQQARW